MKSNTKTKKTKRSTKSNTKTKQTNSYDGFTLPQLKKMIMVIESGDFSPFNDAAENGHANVLRYLANKAAARLPEMIEAGNFNVFWLAAINGHRNVLECLAEKAPAQLPEMIAAGNFLPFMDAAAYGHLNVLEYLAEIVPTWMPVMIAARDFYSFKVAVRNGHLNVLKFLAEKEPARFQEMIAANDFAAYFQIATKKGHLNVLEYIAEKAPALFPRMIAANDFAAFRAAVDSRHQPIINYLLSHAAVLAYAEAHEYEYARYVIPYITSQLESMHAQKQEAEANNPNAIFDVDEATAKRCFYMLRNLIRRNDAGVLDEIRFLLSIPGVKNLAHTAVSRGQSNELLRLALRISNAQAAEILLNLPEVRALAERNHYYREEAQGGLDLRALAQNRESSMTALSTGEQRCLKQALTHYNPTLQQEGMVPKLMTILKELLLERYEDNPARIEIVRDGVKSSLSLPMSWEDFSKLSLNSQEREAAYKAYYQHLDHTAWRYLSKPNPWMHPNAGYVYISDDRRDRWSTFEEYQSLIALLFLAAKDEQIPGIDDFTLESRLDHFIHELALIGRAHNWDKTRYVMKEGEMLTDDVGNPVMEEYDDLEGDRPSCFSGVKRRLFQSVLGHPLLKILSKEVIVREIRDFVRQHFAESIAANNPNVLLQAWNDLVENGNQAAIEPLKVLNISEEQQKRFENYLETKYEGQFAEDDYFKKLVRDAFTVKNPENDCQAVHLGYVGLADLLQKAAAKQTNTSETKEDKELKESAVKTSSSGVDFFSDADHKKQLSGEHKNSKKKKSSHQILEEAAEDKANVLTKNRK